MTDQKVCFVAELLLSKDAKTEKISSVCNKDETRIHLRHSSAQPDFCKEGGGEAYG